MAGNKPPSSVSYYMHLVSFREDKTELVIFPESSITELVLASVTYKLTVLKVVSSEN